MKRDHLLGFPAITVVLGDLDEELEAGYPFDDWPNPHPFGEPTNRAPSALDTAGMAAIAGFMRKKGEIHAFNRGNWKLPDGTRVPVASPRGQSIRDSLLAAWDKHKPARNCVSLQQCLDELGQHVDKMLVRPQQRADEGGGYTIEFRSASEIEPEVKTAQWYTTDAGGLQGVLATLVSE